MPRFIARPVVVEAHQNLQSGLMFPPTFALAIRRHLPDGTIEVATGDGSRVCKHQDWIVRGSDGLFSVMRNAAFEAMYEEQRPAPEERVKRAYNRREPQYV